MRMRPAGFCRPATAGDWPGGNLGASAAASNLHQPVRQLVAVERAGREVLGQHRAALLDRGDETVAWAALLYSRYQRADRRVPYLRRYLGVDTGIRHDLGVALGDRGKDQ